MFSELKAMVVPGIGKHLFLTGTASRGGIMTVWSDQPELIIKNGTKVLLRNRDKMSLVDLEI